MALPFKVCIHHDRSRIFDMVLNEVCLTVPTTPEEEAEIAAGKKVPPKGQMVDKGVKLGKSRQERETVPRTRCVLYGCQMYRTISYFVQVHRKPTG